MSSGAIQVTPLASAADDAAYAEFLAGAQAATLWHTPAWRDVLIACTGAEPRYLLARRGGAVVGAMAAMAREGPFGRIVNSLPFFGSHGDILTSEYAAGDAIEQSFRAAIGGASAASATIIENPFAARAKAGRWGDAPLTDERISQWTPLDPGMNGADLLALIDGSARRNIRRAESEGVRVAVENGAVGFLADCHAANMAEIGGRQKPQAFFDALGPILKPDVDFRIYVARHGGPPVAALLVLYFKGFAEYVTPATIAGARDLQPTAGILFRAMLDAAEEGRRIWNWGGTWTTQEGVYRFKRKWGAEERRYSYRIYLKEGRLLDQTPDVLSAAYPWFFVAPYAALTPAEERR